MRARRLGDTAIQVSEIGVGTMRFGSQAWHGPEVDECRSIVDEAIRSGATFIDTAPSYAKGRSEEILDVLLFHGLPEDRQRVAGRSSPKQRDWASA